VEPRHSGPDSWKDSTAMQDPACNWERSYHDVMSLGTRGFDSRRFHHGSARVAPSVLWLATGVRSLSRLPVRSGDCGQSRITCPRRRIAGTGLRPRLRQFDSVRGLHIHAEGLRSPPCEGGGRWLDSTRGCSILFTLTGCCSEFGPGQLLPPNKGSSMRKGVESEHSSPVRLTARTLDFQSGNRGSIPLRGTMSS
jgi:hypothetical protein